MPATDRANVLADRVRWLDRYRRAVAIGLGGLLALLVMHELSSALGTDWPHAYAMLLALFAAVLSWWLFEASLAWLTALWETECDRLMRDRGLPRAELLPRRRN